MLDTLRRIDCCFYEQKTRDFLSKVSELLVLLKYVLSSLSHQYRLWSLAGLLKICLLLEKLPVSPKTPAGKKRHEYCAMRFCFRMRAVTRRFRFVSYADV
jgi:hypothetical protein